jgi:hypothetical protein
MQTKYSIYELMDLFEFSDEDKKDLPILSPTNDFKLLEENLKKFKKVFKKNYRKVAMKYHPDKHPDKKLAHKKLVVITQLMKMINNVKIQEQIRESATITVKFHFYGSYSSSTWGGTPTSTW